MMVTIKPVTLVRDPGNLHAVARERESRLGVYGSTVEPGRVGPQPGRTQTAATWL